MEKPTLTQQPLTAGLDVPALPRAEPPAVPCVESTPGAQGEILVVDDEPAIVELLVDCLKLAGYRGVGASRSSEALELIRTRPFDVMLCDLMLPDMSGVELMVKARIEAPHMAVLVVTGVADIETAVRAMRLGAYDYLVKPVSPSDVVLRVSSAIEMRRHLLDTQRAQQCLQENLTQLQRMTEIKDSLVQMLVHDLKSPLASAMGYMELLEQKAGESFSERQLRYLQQAYGSCKDVLRMTTTLLDLARLERGALPLHYAPVHIPLLLEETAAEVEPLLAARGGRVETLCHPQAACAFADLELVRRILSNLVSNAVKHTPPGTSVRLGADPGENGWVVIAVSDNGEGIPRDAQEQIFEKYYQVRPEARSTGTGLGLTFCKMAVEAHGGRIWVESTPGQGATFRFTLPTAKTGEARP